MPRGRGRGGYQAPANPAPVSGPGALSARTDGGAGQPIRLAPGGEYGDRATLETQQSAAPMHAAPSVPGPAGQAAPAPPQPLAPLDVFGPSERPGEPSTEGVPFGAGDPGMPEFLPDDPHELARAVFSVYGHPDVLELIDDAYGDLV